MTARIRTKAQALLRAHEYLCKAFFWIGGCLICSIAFTVSYEVGMRYFFNRPTSWAIDFAEYSLLYGTFFGAAWILKMEGHVKVTVLQELLGPKARVIVDFMNSIIGAVACGILFWRGTLDTWDTYVRGVLHIRPVTVPKWLLMWIIPFGLLLFGSYFVRNAFSLFSQMRDLGADKE